MSKSVTKRPPVPRPHEREPWNHAVLLRLHENDPGFCHRFGHPWSLFGLLAVLA
ncbi:hypothetical protein HMPREF9057_00906 [Actinomyces sp. oral taxon 171 str. F0337]|nr:hypothetical protein HMPREF9057_00906 [Actinomyces sp. oral taxon 171 str. F0337]